MFKLTSLNLNGIRSAAQKGLENWLIDLNADCICVQELKAQMIDIQENDFQTFAKMHGYFSCAEKKGYSGVGIYTRHKPSSVQMGFGSSEFDAEGRYIELRFDRHIRLSPNDSNQNDLNNENHLYRPFSIISAYFPSGSSGEERQEAKFRFLDEIYPHLIQLKKERDFILCGDLNIAHQEIDLKNWKGNLKNSGFLPEERAWMTQLLKPSSPENQRENMLDVYRRLQPNASDLAYTWWSNRGRAYLNNVGWRLDYHLATFEIAQLAQKEAIYKEQKFSDHAPITIEYDFHFE